MYGYRCIIRALLLFNCTWHSFTKGNRAQVNVLKCSIYFVIKCILFILFLLIWQLSYKNDVKPFHQFRNKYDYDYAYYRASWKLQLKIKQSNKIKVCICGYLAVVFPYHKVLHNFNHPCECIDCLVHYTFSQTLKVWKQSWEIRVFTV